MSQKQTPNYTFALTVVIIVCFLIGFVTTMNNSMIAFCKSTFQLEDAQAQLVNTAFYGMYVFSILLGMLMSKIGYKKTMIGGLGIVSFGFFLCYLLIGGQAGEDGMIPATDPKVVQGVYYILLGCMSCVAIGIVMLQLVANPYVKELGSPEKGAFRMTLSQAINSVATVFAPMFVSNIIISSNVEGQKTVAELMASTETVVEDIKVEVANVVDPSQITVPFLGLCIFVLALCVILAFLKLPEIKEENATYDTTKKYKSSVFKYPHVWLGALAIFFYMGLEIGVPSMIPAKFNSIYPWLNDDQISRIATSFLAWYWGGMMVGRFIGAAVLNKFQPRVILTACLLLGAACIAISFVLPGMAGVWAMLLAGLFHSVMWPLIFNLGLEELGPHTKAGSGIINIGVIGGATLPLIMGGIITSYKATDLQMGVGLAIGLMFVYYLYEIWFCWKGSKIGLNK